MNKTAAAALWDWYAARQTLPCVACGRVMSTHTIPELEACARRLGIIEAAPFMTPAEIAALPFRIPR